MISLGGSNSKQIRYIELRAKEGDRRSKRIDSKREQEQATAERKTEE